MTTYFNSKQQYLKFREAWAYAVNSDRRFSTLEKCDEQIREAGHCGYRKFGAVSEQTGKRLIPGWITPSHHVLYNILRNKPFDVGFSPVTNHTRLKNGMYINNGLFSAVFNLKCVIEAAKNYHSNIKKAENLRKEKPNIIACSYQSSIARVNKFLEPFDGTVTVDMLASVEIPDIKPLESMYSKGRRISKMIFELNHKNTKPISLWDLYEKVN